MSYSSVVLADSPSYYWRLNDPSGTTATEVVSGVNGTISGGVTLNQPGALVDGDKAMTFNGVDGKIQTVATVAVPQLVTVEGWVKTQSPSGFCAMVSTRGTGSSQAILFGVSGLFPATFADFGTPSGVTANLPLTADTWHYLVFVHTGTTVSFYVDGVLDRSIAQVRGGTADLSIVGIGRSANGQNPFPGSLDEVAIYSYAVTPAQIRSHYEARTSPYRPGSYPAKVVQDGASYYWRLEEPSGTTATEVIQGVNGTISGGVSLNQPGALSDGDKGMTFDGSTGKIQTVANVAAPQTITMEAWVNTANVAGFRSIFSNRSLAATNPILFGLSAGLIPTSYSDDATPAAATGLSAISVGVWHHLVFVHTDVSCTFYVDGAFTKTTAQTRAGASSTAATGIGADPNNVNFWSGSLDDVALYPYALTAAQVSAHYLLGKQSQSWPGVPWWIQIQGGDILDSFNIWQPITPSDTVDLPRGVSGGVWVGVGGDVAAVMGNNLMPVVLAAVPTGAWLPIAAKRINSTGTTASGLVALYEV